MIIPGIRMCSKPLEVQYVFLFSIVLFSLNSLGLVLPSAASNIINSKDWQALISIKDQIRSDPSGTLDQWNDSIHFCYWKGVTCNSTHQRVVALELSGLALGATLSPYIGNLTFLTKLNLMNNFFYGTIPREIGLLYQLQYLSLSDNFFQGEIPANLIHCSDIRDINLERNNLEGKVPAEFGSFSNIHQLSLCRNNLNGLLPPSLGNLSSLRVLTLSYNKFEGGIPPDFGKLSKLELLSLSSNKFSGALPILLFNISSIKHFILASNLLNGSIPVDLGPNFPKLRTFYIGENQFSGPIPESITNASGLKFLDIGLNSFSGPLPVNMAHLKQLQRLDFSRNPVGNNGSSWVNFLTSLTNCTKLTILHLNDNKHRGVLPGSIANLSKELISLRVDGNHISGGIPESIGKLRKLQGLYLSRNNFAGAIPSSIGNIPLLSILEMQENMLEGDIPISLSNCSGLQKFDLSQNKLTGAIPYELSGLSSLIGLRLAQNQLTGPLQVGSSINLVILDVSNNDLDGELSPTLGSCVAAELLSLQDNHFTGSIPQSFVKLRNIQFLDLSSNNLSGLIPRGVAGLPFIQYLNLSFNALEGELPNDGLFTNSRAFSIKGNEKLCGGLKSLKLPECQKEKPEKNSRKIKISFSPLLDLLLAGFLILLVLEYISVYYYITDTRTARAEVYSDCPLGDQYPKLSYTELVHATNNFSPANLIARGRYSSVYKGILNHNGQAIAVKVLSLQSSGARKSFQAECEALRNIRHRNLLKIVTSFSGTDLEGSEFKALVYAFMHNGDLESWLHPVSPNLEHKNLSLIQRLHIAIDVASAIDYLHNCCEIRLIHRDIKPSNVLLDDELCARLGDFGSARSLLLPLNRSSHVRIRSSAMGIIGTVGYVALECGTGGRVSTFVDVYSYGILVLEMFTGKKPTDSIFRDNFCLHNYVKMAIPDQVMKIADPRLLARGENELHTRRCNSHKIEKCLALIFLIGLRCSVPLPRERMDIADALVGLQAIRDAFLRVDEIEY